LDFCRHGASPLAAASVLPSARDRRAPEITPGGCAAAGVGLIVSALQSGLASGSGHGYWVRIGYWRTAVGGRHGWSLVISRLPAPGSPTGRRRSFDVRPDGRRPDRALLVALLRRFPVPSLRAARARKSAWRASRAWFWTP